jgi:hypothetical protein
MVDWCYLGGVRFSEPFFEDSIARALRRPFSAAFLRRAPLEAWDAAAWPDPAGLIFHMSRCGSTLVSQMLKALPGVTVFSEAPPVDSIVRAHEFGVDVNEERHAIWLRAIGRAIGRGGAQGQRAYVLKLDCWHALDLPLFRRAFPNSPWIFLYRDPIQVLASLASQPAEWNLRGYLKAERFGFDPASVPPAALTEYRTRLLAGIMRSVLEYGDELDGHLVNYSQLPDWGWSALPRLFGLDASAGETARMGEVAACDAKRSGVVFAPDAERKRSNATPELRELCEAHLYPLLPETGSAKKRLMSHERYETRSTMPRVLKVVSKAVALALGKGSMMPSGLIAVG